MLELLNGFVGNGRLGVGLIGRPMLELLNGFFGTDASASG